MHEMLGALDSRILLAVFNRIGVREIEQMKQINEEIKKSLDEEKFIRYWNKNTAFHNVYLNLSPNDLILYHINILRRRLFEFNKNYWSLRRKQVIVSEHETMIVLIEKGDAIAAVEFMRDYHTNLDLDAESIYHR